MVSPRCRRAWLEPQHLGLHDQRRPTRKEGKALTNFQRTLPPEGSDMAEQVLRDPYNFDFLTLAHPLEERKLERGLLAT
jgi:predicted nuclease of restriction endonuclease-like (RecB) superfamily